MLIPTLGNLMVHPQQNNPDGPVDLWLIDFGMMGRINREESIQYAQFLWHVWNDNTDGMVDVLCRIGNLAPNVDRQSLKQLAQVMYAEVKQGSALGHNGEERQQELARQVNRFIRQMKGVQLPGHAILLSRTLGLIEGITIDLLQTPLIDAVKPSLRKRVYSIQQLGIVFEQGLAVISSYAQLPAQVASINQELAQIRASSPRTMPIVWALLIIAATHIPDNNLRYLALIGFSTSLLISSYSLHPPIVEGCNFLLRRESDGK